MVMDASCNWSVSASSKMHRWSSLSRKLNKVPRHSQFIFQITITPIIIRPKSKCATFVSCNCHIFIWIHIRRNCTLRTRIEKRNKVFITLITNNFERNAIATINYHTIRYNRYSKKNSICNCTMTTKVWECERLVVKQKLDLIYDARTPWH